MKRKNIKLSDELATWFEERAAEIGMSQTSLMALACQHYKEHDKAIRIQKAIMSKKLEQD